MRHKYSLLVLSAFLIVLIALSFVSAATTTPRVSKDNYQKFLFSMLWVKAKTLSLTSEKIAFTNIHIAVSEPEDNTSITFERLYSAPEGTGAPAGAYQHIKVVNSNIRDSSITSLKMEFKVKKSWLNERGVEDSDIILMRYTYPEKWINLPARKTTESLDYVYYEAEAPGFSYISYFSIVANAPVQIKKTIINQEQSEIPQQNKTEYKTYEYKNISQNIDATGENKNIIQKIINLILFMFKK